MVSALHMMNSVTFSFTAWHNKKFQYYDSLNIEIRLVHLSIIDSPSDVDVTSQFSALRSFMTYLGNNFEDMHCDHANLMM